MAEPAGVVLGFDPGGKKAFGWSVCGVVGDDLQPPARSGLAIDACSALDGVREAMDLFPGDTSVLAAGIDAPLLWSSTNGRSVDDAVRQALRNSGFKPSKLGGTVQHFNSLRGSCTVQGVMLAKFLREVWDVEITEAHPKAVEHLLRHSGQPSMVKMIDHLTHGLITHERDAVLSAITAWAMYRRLPA